MEIIKAQCMFNFFKVKCTYSEMHISQVYHHWWMHLTIAFTRVLQNIIVHPDSSSSPFPGDSPIPRGNYCWQLSLELLFLLLFILLIGKAKLRKIKQFTHSFKVKNPRPNFSIHILMWLFSLCGHWVPLPMHYCPLKTLRNTLNISWEKKLIGSFLVDMGICENSKGSEKSCNKNNQAEQNKNLFKAC